MQWEPEKFGSDHESAFATLLAKTRPKKKKKKKKKQGRGETFESDRSDDVLDARFKANLENKGCYPVQFPPRPKPDKHLTTNRDSRQVTGTTRWLENMLRMILPQLRTGNNIILRDYNQDRDPVQRNDSGSPAQKRAGRQELRFSRLITLTTGKRKRLGSVPESYKFNRKLEDLLGVPCFYGNVITEEHFETLSAISGLLHNGELMKWFGGRYMACASYLAARELLLTWGKVAASSDLIKDLEREFEDVKRREQHVSDNIIKKHYATTTTTYDFTHPKHAEHFGYFRLWSHPTVKPDFSWEKGVQAWPYSLCQPSDSMDESDPLASRCHDMRLLTPNEQMQQLFYCRYLRLAFELTQRNHQLYGGEDGNGAAGYKTLYDNFSSLMRPR